MKIFREHIIFFLILISAIVLRFIPLFDYQFTYDELSGLDRTQFTTYGELIEKGVKVDAHPALVQLFLYFIVKLTGYSEWIIKLPFLLCSIGTIIYAYLTALKNFNKTAGIYAALFFSYSLVFVFYAPIARMYACGIFFSAGMVFHFCDICLRKNNNTLNYALFAILALASALNHHLNALFAATLFLCFFIFLNSINLKKLLITASCAFALYAPHLPITLHQIGHNIGVEAGGWLEAPDWSEFPKLISVLLGTGYLWLVVFLLALIVLVQNRKIAFSKIQLVFVLLFIANFFIVYFYSILRTPIFQYSVLTFAAVPFILFISSLLPASGKLLQGLSIIFLAGCLLYQTYFVKDYLHQSVETVFDYQFKRTLYYKQKFGNENVYPLFFDCDTLMRKIYFSKYKSHFDCRISSDTIISYGQRVNFIIPATEKNNNPDSIYSSIRLFKKFVSGLNTPYITMSSSTPLYQAIVREYFPYIIEDTQTQAVHYQLYSKSGPSDSEIDKTLRRSDPENPGLFNYELAPALNVYAVDSTLEFPITASARYNDVIKKEGETVLLKCKLHSISTGFNLLEGCLSVNGPNKENLSYNSKSISDFTSDQKNSMTLYSDLYAGRFHQNVPEDGKLQVYLWNRGKANFKIESFEIQVVEHWKRKWELWK